MDAVILLNKPVGITSFSAISVCRRAFQEKKAGHTGTLDPNASGLMIVLLGKYTKLVPYCVKDHKHYLATFEMGKKTDTEDIWGTIIETKQFVNHTQEELDSMSSQFMGNIKQIPPMYSAIKKDGKKLYEYARKGIEVERKERDAFVSSLSVKQIGENQFEMDVVVSSGTYVRTLISDYCKALGELGTMTSLVRKGIEQLSIEDSCTLEQIQEGNYTLLDPMKVIDPSWKFVECKMVEMVKNGKAVYLNHVEEENIIFTSNGQLLSAYHKEEDGLYHCVRGLF